MSETNYARLCRVRGYDIANKRKLQNVRGLPISRTDIPEEWLLEFSLAEGIADDDLKLEVTCSTCRGGFRYDMALFQGLPNSPKTLRDIPNDAQFSSEPCVLCGAHGSQSFRFLADAEIG